MAIRLSDDSYLKIQNIPKYQCMPKNNCPRLLISNLPSCFGPFKRVSYPLLEAALRRHFEQFGVVQNLHIRLQSRAVVAYVLYREKSSISRALAGRPPVFFGFPALISIVPADKVPGYDLHKDERMAGSSCDVDLTLYPPNGSYLNLRAPVNPNNPPLPQNSSTSLPLSNVSLPSSNAPTESFHGELAPLNTEDPEENADSPAEGYAATGNIGDGICEDPDISPEPEPCYDANANVSFGKSAVQADVSDTERGSGHDSGAVASDVEGSPPAMDKGNVMTGNSVASTDRFSSPGPRVSNDFRTPSYNNTNSRQAPSEDVGIDLPQSGWDESLPLSDSSSRGQQRLQDIVDRLKSRSSQILSRVRSRVDPPRASTPVYQPPQPCPYHWQYYPPVVYVPYVPHPFY